MVTKIKKSSIIKKAVIFVLTIAFITANGFASEIKFLTHSLQGQTYVDAGGELRGKKHTGKRAFNLELVREMMAIMNHSGGLKELPFKRGLMMIQNHPDMALFNVSRTAEREDTVKWVGPLQKEVDFFYEMKSTPTGIKILEDAKKVKEICVLNGSIHETILRKNNFTNIQTNYSYVGCFLMLKAGRVDLTPSASSAVSIKLNGAGILPNQIQQTPVILLESKGYIAFSKNISDETIQKWQDAFSQIKKSGKYQQLYQLYFLPEGE